MRGLLRSATVLLALSGSLCRGAVHLEWLELPDGFGVELMAEVPGARSMCLGDDGTLFVGTRGAGTVYAVVDRDGDFAADGVYVIDDGLWMPNGVAFRDGSLYVAEVNRILKYEDIESRLEKPPDPVVVHEGLPSAEHHGWRYIAFGPDGRLYVAVGAPCNVCDEGDPYASITRMNPDGSGFEVYARGVRNSMGLDWHPDTGDLWFTDNGRDWLGDDRPPDELNRAPRAGLHFGFPYLHGSDVWDPEYGEAGRGMDLVTPEKELGPHVAALGMLFYTGDMFPTPYRGAVFIAEHGSWNRSVPIGYRITLVPMVGGSPAGYRLFARGWLRNGSAWGRPVDLLELPDGSLLVSDDKAGAIYRVSYEP